MYQANRRFDCRAFHEFTVLVPVPFRLAQQQSRRLKRTMAQYAGRNVVGDLGKVPLHAHAYFTAVSIGLVIQAKQFAHAIIVAA